MNIHEYQAKALLREFDLPISDGGVARTVAEAMTQAQSMKTDVWVVKAQIHAGGRGKGGGVKIAKSLDDVETHASNILGMNLVTPQTGPEGKDVHAVYIEAGTNIETEFYASFLLDRATSRIALVVSPDGGMDIEEIAEKTPERILTIAIDPVTGFMPYHGREAAFFLGLTGKNVRSCASLLAKCYDAFTELDGDLLEINPLALNTDGELIILDSKFAFDDNALCRHPALEHLRDVTEEDPMELKAKEFDLSYIKLDGTIGCMVNGAGLAMATLDIIKLHGGSPANFLDVGGGATAEKVTEAFKLILSDPNVKAVLVNIFGGIMKCDIIADGIVTAAKEVDLTVPLVVRLAGTNVEAGKEILAQSGLPIIAAENLADAAQKAVNASGEGK
jgi:succinyl-CoA synthetase beta subunit